MLVLGLDLETSGLEVKTSKIIEIGAILWDTKKAKPLQMMNRLIQQEDLSLDPLITKITGIETEDLEKYGIPLELALKELESMASHAEFIVAHNGNGFDRHFMEKAWEEMPETRIDLKWIDTSTDIPFTEDIGTKKLAYLACEHQFLNPFSHRALFDVMTMLKVMSHYSDEEIIRLAESETKRVIAKVSFEDKDLAKKEGFRWDPSSKTWYKDIKEIQLSDMKFPFQIDYV